MLAITSDAECRRNLAESLTADIRRASDRATAVVLFGSVARGDATGDSDLDLLVVASDRGQIPSIRSICREVRHPKVSLIVHTRTSLEKLWAEDWLFVKHLADEAVGLYDPRDELEAMSRIGFPGHSSVSTEIRTHSERLARIVEHAGEWSDLLFPLASTYSLAKRIAMLANSRKGVSIFQRDRALAATAALYPQTAHDIEVIRVLAPFYAHTRGVRDAALPFSSRDSRPQLLAAAAAVRRVVDAATT